jgi:flagellar biosynthesis protein FlgN
MTETNTDNPLLAQQLTQLSQLESLLQQEREVLQKHSPDALLEITQQKNNLLAEIQTLDSTISTSQVFLQQKSKGELDVKLQEVENILTRCKELNQVNGQIITQSELAIDRMKSSLLEKHDKSSMTYDSKGKKHVGLSSLGIKA